MKSVCTNCEDLDKRPHCFKNCQKLKKFQDHLRVEQLRDINQHVKAGESNSYPLRLPTSNQQDE